MSLTSHLKNSASPIGQFLHQRFSHTQDILKDVNHQFSGVDTIVPSNTNSYPYGYIGTTIDYRIRYAFGITPYRHLKAWWGATGLTYRPVKSKKDVPMSHDEIEELLDELGAIRGFEVAQGPYPLKFILSFFNSLSMTLDSLQPAGKLLTNDANRLLTRYCFVLSLFEEVYRNPNSYLRGPLMVPTAKRSIEELLAIPQETWIDDLCEMFKLFYKREHRLLSQPYTLNPEFSASRRVGGADADLIVGGCLIDIKASIFPKIETEYLHQIVGYLLLDYDDTFHINSVGIYMARQGVLCSWPVPGFLQSLTGENAVTLASLREEFSTVYNAPRIIKKPPR